MGCASHMGRGRAETWEKADFSLQRARYDWEIGDRGPVEQLSKQKEHILTNDDSFLIRDSLKEPKQWNPPYPAHRVQNPARLLQRGMGWSQKATRIQDDTTDHRPGKDTSSPGCSSDERPTVPSQSMRRGKKASAKKGKVRCAGRWRRHCFASGPSLRGFV